MQTFEHKVAVITGAASGIGRALAHHCAQEGMRLVLADLDPAALATVADELRTAGTSVLAVPTDVAQAQAVEALAEATMRAYGAVHLLCNNAGVGIVTPILASTIDDWQWALGVNLWGVIHGVRVFVPIMRTHHEACYIVNTASIAGLISPPGLGVYRTTKHAVVALSEALYHELAAEAPQIGISVLCPGIVKTQIMRSAQRQAEAAHATAQSAERDETQRLHTAVAAGMPPEAVAAAVFAAIRARQFYILTHPERNWQIQHRSEDILLGRNPTTTLLANHKL